MTSTDLYADKVFQQFLKLIRFHRQYARQIIDEQGIKPRELSILHFFAETGAASVGQARAYMHQSISTISALIAKLEKDGYVTRTRSQADNRVVMVDLTEAGHNLVAHTPLRGIPLLRHNIRQLPEERLQQINGVLVEIVQMMEVENTV